MADAERRLVARLTAPAGGTIERLLQGPHGLDVWERRDDELIVAAGESQLAELERRRLATVERLSTIEEFEARASGRSDSEGTGE